MNSNQNAPVFSSASAVAAPERRLPWQYPANDNAAGGRVPDTTALLALPGVAQSIRATLRRYGVAPQDMADAIAEVQTRSIETAREGHMPCGVGPWKALAMKIAVHWALDRRREAKARSKHNAGLCDDPDAYLRPTLHWEHRDPVDTKKYLAVLKELFASESMPEHGEEILQAEADGVSHEDIATEIGLSTSVVRGRLFRMRAKFRTRLAALGMLTLVLLLLVGALLSPVSKVAAPAPQTKPAQSAGPEPSVHSLRGDRPENRASSPNEIAP